MDIRTCKPLPKALVEVWSCNSTGYYSSFTNAPALDPITFPVSTDPAFTNSASISRLIELGNENLAVNKTDEVSYDMESLNKMLNCIPR
jgi:protocatechuate 3,4-dioxygenase beta subunit